MGKGRYPRIIPHDFQTVGAMAAANVPVRAWCRSCGLVLKVSPAMLAAYYGAEFSLVNRLARCRKVDCDGEVFFLARGHARFETLLYD